MYFVGSPLSAEQLVESNGSRGPDWMPVVFWPAGTSELFVRTRMVPQAPQRRSLVREFREWQAAQARPRKQ
jgi:hypothetical protein